MNNYIDTPKEEPLNATFDHNTTANPTIGKENSNNNKQRWADLENMIKTLEFATPDMEKAQISLARTSFVKWTNHPNMVHMDSTLELHNIEATAAILATEQDAVHKAIAILTKEQSSNPSQVKIVNALLEEIQRLLPCASSRSTKRLNIIAQEIIRLDNSRRLSHLSQGSYCITKIDWAQEIIKDTAALHCALDAEKLLFSRHSSSMKHVLQAMR
ncbi:MAG: hypothetical protein NXI01_07695 [Gammaproteobacteria bacterium]|nr:hypothetical protein [Gammaproteobacteria bacterium]